MACPPLRCPALSNPLNRPGQASGDQDIEEIVHQENHRDTQQDIRRESTERKQEFALWRSYRQRENAIKVQLHKVTLAKHFDAQATGMERLRKEEGVGSRMQADEFQQAGPKPGHDIARCRMISEMLQRSVPNKNPQQPRVPKPIPDYKDLAIAKLKSASSSKTCDFCKYGTTFGLNNPELYLPKEASCRSYCWKCRFHLKIDENIRIHPLDESLPARPTLPPMIISQGGTERNIAQFQPPQFCPGCPWGQIDVTKAKICDGCREERVKVIKHSRHNCVSLNEIPNANTSRECMVCSNYALEGCTECPLRLCEACSTFMRSYCKGSVTFLIYHLRQTHIRNDAFLLRDDGGGWNFPEGRETPGNYRT